MSTVQSFYDASTEREWARLTIENEPHRWLEFQVAMHIMAKYLPPPPARVLDVGGGPGRYTIALAQQGYRLTLFDLSGELLSMARRNGSCGPWCPSAPAAGTAVMRRVSGPRNGTSGSMAGTRGLWGSWQWVHSRRITSPRVASQ